MALASRMHTVKVSAVAKPSAAAKAPVAARRAAPLGLAGVAALVAAAPARAEEVDAVDATVSGVIEAVKAAGAAVRTGIEVAGAGVKALKEGYEVASPYIQQGVDAVAPVVKEAAKVTSEVAGPAISKAVPIVQDTLTGAVKSAGVDINAVAKTATEAAKTATEASAQATPFLAKFWTFLTTSEPVVLAEYGLGAFALYLLAPSLLGGLAGGLRGYAGDLSAVQALEAINADGNALIVDIRTDKEKESSGVPDVPGGGSKLLEVSFASIEDRKLRGALRDAGYIEAQITALQISYLKRVGKGTKVILLDRNGGAAKTVAKELARRGFGRVYVVDGGFDGWVRSKLLVKPVAGASYQALPSIARTISSRTIAARKALPSPK